MTGSPTVLHVVESFGGGVSAAVAQYRRAMPGCDHHLLRTERIGDFIDSGETDGFRSVIEMPRGFFAARRKIREVVEDLNPDVVHAHSSYAGAYTRTSILSSPSRPIVYTPHGYASERRDVAWIVRRAFQVVELALSINTASYAACSPREARLSRAYARSHRVFYVPNVHLSIDPGENLKHSQSSSTQSDGPFLVVATGRLTPARDPHHFAEIVELVRQSDPTISFKWIGGGEQKYATALKRLGVEVTGWLPRDEALSHLARARMLIHTAAWDGFPMVLLEANAARVPTIVRQIAAFDEVPAVLKCKTPEDFARAIVSARSGGWEKRDNLEEWDSFLADNNTATQSCRLKAAYKLKPMARDSPVRS